MTWALILCACLAQPGLPVPSERPARAEALSPLPTRMGKELLALSPLVAEVTTLRVTPFGIGTAVVRLRIDRRLSPTGPEPGEELVVFAYDGHFVRTGRDLVHLLPFRRGGRWRVLQRVDGRDRDYRAKVAVTRANLALLAIRDAARRDAASLEMVMELAGVRDVWTRDYALSELHFLVLTRRDLFTPDVRARLAVIAASTSDDVLRRGVELVTGIAASAPSPVPSADSEEPTKP